MHLDTEPFKQRADADPVQIPFKGCAPAEQELGSGRVPVVTTGFSVLSYVKKGGVRVRAVTAAKRHRRLSDAPSNAGSGYPRFGSVRGYGLSAPRRTPIDAARRWNTEMNKALQSTAIAGRLRGVGLAPTGGSPEDLAAPVRTETEKLKPVVRSRGIKSDRLRCG